MLQEMLDGDLSARVFSLLSVLENGHHQQRHAQKSKQRLDLSILSFFQNFRRVYVGETFMHSSKVGSIFVEQKTDLAMWESGHK